jgi:hypothetical protein
MTEIIAVWVLTLVSIMADGTPSAANIVKANRKECMAARSELIADLERYRAAGAVKGWSIECEAIPVEVRK